MVMKFLLNNKNENNWNELFINSNDGSNEGLIHIR